jgi:hypothetical protein
MKDSYDSDIQEMIVHNSINIILYLYIFCLICGSLRDYEWLHTATNMHTGL